MIKKSTISAFVLTLALLCSFNQTTLAIAVTFELEEGESAYLCPYEPTFIGDSIVDRQDLTFLGTGTGKSIVSGSLYSKSKYVVFEAKGRLVMIKDVNGYYRSGKLIIKPYILSEKLPVKTDSIAVVAMGDVAIDFDFSDIRGSTVWSQIKGFAKTMNKQEDEISSNYKSIANGYLFQSGLLISQKDENYLNNVKIDIDLALEFFTVTSYYSIELKKRWEGTIILTDMYGDTIESETIDDELSSDEHVINSFQLIIHEFLTNSIEKTEKHFLKSRYDEHWRANVGLKKLNVFNYTDSSTTIKNATDYTVTVYHDDGHGSGCIIGQQGYVLTNYHVVAKHKNDLKIITADNDTLMPELVRYDPLFDLALLKVPEAFDDGFTFGPTKPMPIGQPVFVLGTPADQQLKQSVSKGYIAGYRELEYNTFYQVGASINPGNSGGALVDQNMNLVGVINAKLLGPGVKKMGFAIPIEFALKQLNLELTK
jgi:hypothetical protein